jgi:hypothetical protein
VTLASLKDPSDHGLGKSNVVLPSRLEPIGYGDDFPTVSADTFQFLSAEVLKDWHFAVATQKSMTRLKEWVLLLLECFFKQSEAFLLVVVRG